MENVIYIKIILVVRLLFWLQCSVLGTDLQIGSLELCRINKPLLYKDVSCPTGTRMISYNDVFSHSKQLLHEFTKSLWINTTESFTPWMIFKGIYTINAEHIVNRKSVHNMTQFIHCIQFCSIYNHRYIGLQEDFCYCLSSDALDTANPIQISTRIAKICTKGHIMYCTSRNKENKIAVYDKDDNTYEGFGECLTLKIKSNTDWSFVPSLCNKTNTSILCKEKNDPSGKCSNEQCVSGQESDGQIVLKITNCSEKRHALCFVMESILEFNISSKLSTTKYADCDAADTRSFNSSSTLIVVVPAVSLFILIVLVAITIVIVIRFCKQRKSFAHGAVYAAVSKEMKHDANLINHGDCPEVLHAIIKEDNTYDHTDFTTRAPQTDTSSYDTMENIQLTGESIYHHTVTFTTRPQRQQTDASNYGTTGNIQQAGESIYHHTATFKTSANKMQGDESVYHHTSNFKLPTDSEHN